MILLVSRGSVQAQGAGGADSQPSPVWMLVSLSLTGAIVTTLDAAFAGYPALAALIFGQVFWLGVLAASSFLLLWFIDELCSGLFSPQGWAAKALTGLFTLRRSAIAQAGVLVSAAL